MKEKLIKLLSSVRFYLVVIFGVAYILEQTGIMPGAFAKAIEITSSILVTTRTIDNAVNSVAQQS